MTEREGFQRVVLAATITLTFGLISFALPPPMDLLFIVVCLGWVFTLMRALRPGRCVVCRERTVAALPRDIRYTPPKWWNFWSIPARGTMIFVCPEHVAPVMMMKVFQEVIDRAEDEEA